MGIQSSVLWLHEKLQEPRDIRFLLFSLQLWGTFIFSTCRYYHYYEWMTKIILIIPEIAPRCLAGPRWAQDRKLENTHINIWIKGLHKGCFCCASLNSERPKGTLGAPSLKPQNTDTHHSYNLTRGMNLKWATNRDTCTTHI